METLAYILIAESYESDRISELNLTDAMLKAIAITAGLQLAFIPHPAMGLMTSGSTGADVQALQSQLVALGYPVKETGVYDQLTKQSVIAFQKATQLKADGIVGNQTQSALATVVKGDEFIKKPSPTTPTTGDENVIRIQENLKKVGVYRGKVNGVLDLATIKAIDDARSISCMPLARILEEDIQQNQW